MWRHLSLSVAALAVCLAVPGCDLLDPNRPVAHADTEVFGNLLQVERAASEDQAWLAVVRVGAPRELTAAEAAEGKPTPQIEEALVADVLVGADTVVLSHGQPAAVEAINLGTEVAVIPVPGSTRMMGTSRLTVRAAYLTDFDTYRRWRLPGLRKPGDRGEVRDDPDRINSDGVEHAPVPVADGKILYFAARLRPPVEQGEPWQGARREGMSEPGQGGVTVERSYRTELGEDGWTPPRLVRFPGLESSRVVRVSWVSGDETSCLVTVEEEDGTSWIGSTARSPSGKGWAEPSRVLPDQEGQLSDAAYLAGSRSKMVVTVQSAPGALGDLWLFDPSAESPFLPLQPTINSDAAEWGPRVGPDNQLLFDREDHQLVFSGGVVRSLRLPGPHRVVVTEAAPTADGRWVFFCLPRYAPGELDQDIHVATWDGEASLGPPVPVDEWRPAPPGEG